MKLVPLRRGYASSLARAGAILGLLIHLLPFAAAIPRPARGGSVDRTPAMVLARCRQAQTDGVADDRPSPSAPALAPAPTPTALAPDPAGCSIVDVWDGLASPPIPGTLSRSPPAS